MIARYNDLIENLPCLLYFNQNVSFMFHHRSVENNLLEIAFLVAC